jgi:outer membrane protein assembly factor BamB
MRSCGGCGGIWDAPARFCGRCGGPLTVVSWSPTDGRRRWQVVAVTTVSAVAVLAVLGLASAELRLPRLHTGDPAVSLPDAEEVPGGRALDPDERAAALAPFDPDRITCEPAGCERWRRSVAQGWFGNVDLDADQVVIALDELIGIDLATGTDRWRVPFAAELRWEPEPEPGWMPEPPQVSVGAGAIAVASEHGVQLVERDGRHRWARMFPEGASLETVLVVDEVVVLFHHLEPSEVEPWAEDPDDAEVLTDDLHVVEQPWGITVVDAADGRTRWQREGHAGHTQRGLLGDGRYGVTVADGEDVHVLDLATGEVRFTFPLAEDGWFWSAGEVIGVNDVPPRERLSDDDPARPATLRFLSAVDGRPIEGFRGLDLHAFQELDDLLLLFATTLDRDAEHGTEPAAEPGIELLAFEPGGTIRWQLDLGPAGPACCGSALDLGDGRLLVAADPTTERVVVDAASGRILGRRGPWLAEVDDETGFYQHGPSLLAELRYGGAGASLRLHDAAGRVLAVRGHAWPFQPREGGLDGDQPILLVSGRELVAVGFP